MTNEADAHRWFATKQSSDLYEHKLKTTVAVAPHTLSPEDYGHHRSYCARHGNKIVRHWAFEEESGRDLAYVRFRPEVIDG